LLEANNQQHKDMAKKKTKLSELVKAARSAGASVTVSLEPKQMPTRFPNDHALVKLLIEESERASKLGNNWMAADVPNQVAAEACLRHGWAFSLAAAWLRCKLKNELLPESERKAVRSSELVHRVAIKTLLRLKRETAMRSIGPICFEEWQCCRDIIAEEMTNLLTTTKSSHGSEPLAATNG
jgi:hypothetical protein